MVKCKDCAKLEGLYIQAWNEYVYRCSKFRTLRMRIDEDIGECLYFEAKKLGREENP